MGQMRVILCTVIVFTILVFGSVFEENILLAIEAQLSTTLQITKLTTGGDGTFDFTVTGPTSYNPSITTAGSGNFNGDVVVYHSFDSSQNQQSGNVPNFMVNQGSYGHNADAFELDKYFIDPLETDLPPFLGGSAVTPTDVHQVILGNWNHISQWNFLVNDETEKYSINFWVHRLNILDFDDQIPEPVGSSILGTLDSGLQTSNVGNAFNLFYFEDGTIRVNIIKESVPIVELSSINLNPPVDGSFLGWQMVTIVVDKTDSATIYINGTNPMSVPVAGLFTPFTNVSPPVIDGPLAIDSAQVGILSNSGLDGNYLPFGVDATVDDLCIIKDYIFSQDDLDALYNNGQGMPCADGSNSGTSTVEVPYITQHGGLLGGNSVDTYLLDPIPFDVTPPHDFAIGSIPEHYLIIDDVFGSQSVRNIVVRVAHSGSFGTLEGVIYSNVTLNKINGDEVVIATSDSIDFTNPPSFITLANNEDYFVTLNFTSEPIVPFNPAETFIGIKGTGIDLFQNFRYEPPVANSGERAVCINFGEPTAPWDLCSNYGIIPVLGFPYPNSQILNEININAFNIPNGQIDSINFVGNGEGVNGPTSVDPGTYSIQESIPSGWNLTSATCNDGYSSFSVDTVSGIEITPGANIECTFENELSSPDTDGDGIYNEVDTLPTTFSDDFSDVSLGGTSSGTITTRGDQILTITKETNPSGVRITADITGGLLPAVVNACGGISIITLNPGDDIIVTCGSITIDVINGQVEVKFISTEGTQGTTSLTAGNSITFDQDKFSFIAPPTNTQTVIIDVEGTPISISPGDTNTSPPEVGAIIASQDPIQVGTLVEASSTFTDLGPLEVHTAEWDWGDQITSAGVVTENGLSGTVTGSHTYSTLGVYAITLTITDDAGDSGSSIFQFVVIYDPSGGFVTGGGWIDSPEGAYVAEPLLVGKATFGFVSKYQQGANVPTGNTQFSFHVADLKFKSTEYDWLVVAGSNAKFKGTGTINGQGNYGFQLFGFDADINTNDSHFDDKFRIKIWDKNNGDVVVYDNNMGQSEATEPSTILGGGSIVIHKP